MDFNLSDEDTKGWLPAPSHTSWGCITYFCNPEGELCQFTFNFPYLPADGVEGALRVASAKILADGFTRPSEEKMAEMHKAIARRMVADVLNRAIAQHQARDAVNNQDPLAGYKGRPGGDA